MSTKQNFKNGDTLVDLIARRATIEATIQTVRTGYGLTSTIEIDFLNCRLTDLFDAICKASEKAVVPLLEKAIADLDKQIAILSRAK